MVEELTWEGTPTCGWGEVRKNLHCAGKALSIGGVGYDYNSIGTHLPGSDIPQDIVYDISDYSATYPYLTLGVGMPDGASNAAKFSVLVDDVVADSVVYTSGGGESPSPMTMRAYVKDAEKDCPAPRMGRGGLRRRRLRVYGRQAAKRNGGKDFRKQDSLPPEHERDGVRLSRLRRRW